MTASPGQAVLETRAGPTMADGGGEGALHELLEDELGLRVVDGADLKEAAAGRLSQTPALFF